MALIVQKYGGTSIGSAERIRAVAERVAETAKAGNQVAVVVSAIAGETDALVALGHELGGSPPPPREFDVLLATGEQKSIALLAMAIQGLGQPARSLTATQIRLLTDDAHNRARILDVGAERIHRELERGVVTVIAGFQGVDEEGNITTLGRGGSDTSAVAIAASLGARYCSMATT